MAKNNIIEYLLRGKNMSSFGVALPLVNDSSDGFRMLKVKDVIKQNFKMLILTTGERVMEPEFESVSDSFI